MLNDQSSSSFLVAHYLVGIGYVLLASESCGFFQKKYCLFVAKEYMSDKEDNNQRLEEVVGMLEMGIHFWNTMMIQHMVLFV